MELSDIFLNQLPKIDLHGFDRESAKLAVCDFVDEAIAMRYERILIIHGIGYGIVKESVHDALKSNKKVLSFHVCGENIGCTIAFIDCN